MDGATCRPARCQRPRVCAAGGRSCRCASRRSGATTRRVCSRQHTGTAATGYADDSTTARTEHAGRTGPAGGQAPSRRSPSAAVRPATRGGPPAAAAAGQVIIAR